MKSSRRIVGWHELLLNQTKGNKGMTKTSLLNDKRVQVFIDTGMAGVAGRQGRAR